MSGRRRLDAEMVRRGLVPGRAEATELIAGRRVLVGGAVAEKAAHQVRPGDPIELIGAPRRFVSRGGEKLERALDHFGIEVDGLRVLDAGASTGGFTDCLLQRGAARVVAVDVGYGQIHERLRADPRVDVHERLHVRDLAVDTFGRFRLIVADLSFISLTKVVEPLLGVAAPDAELVLLVKPQFEAGRSEVSRGRGVITDPEVRRRTVEEVRDAYERAGAVCRDVVESPILGADGNAEFLIHLVVGER